MQPEHAITDQPPERDDVAAYVATMSRQLAQVCVMAGLDKAARLLEDAAEAAYE